MRSTASSPAPLTAFIPTAPRGSFTINRKKSLTGSAGCSPRNAKPARFPFQLGVSHPSPKISLERLRRARSLKPSAVQVILPDWFPVTIEEAIAFLERMAAEANPIGLVLYNPPHAKRVLSPEQLTALSSCIPQLVGCKVAAGDQKWFDELGDTARRISVFTPGHHLATHWPMGSSGAYSNVACISPRGARRWSDLIVTDLPAAQEFQRRLLGFFDRSITPYITQLGYSNPAVDKLLAAIGGWSDIGTRMRWPYRSIPEDHVEALASLRAGPFQNCSRHDRAACFGVTSIIGAAARCVVAGVAMSREVIHIEPQNRHRNGSALQIRNRQRSG